MTPNRRLVFVDPHPIFGGPENQALRLSGPLGERGWETVVVLTDERGTSYERLRAAGITIVRTPISRVRAVPDPRAQARFVGVFREQVRRIGAIALAQGADVVVVPGLENPHAAFAAKRAALPVVWQLLGTRSPLVARRALTQVVVRMADVVMVTGLSLVDEHPGLHQLGPERIVPFFPPVDVSMFCPDEARRRAARQELQIADDAVVVGNVANLNAQKDHLTFLRAAARLRREVSQRTVFLWLGASTPTQVDYEREVWAVAAELGLRRGVDVLHVEPGARVRDLVPALDVFWMTSEQRSEGIPTGMLEAMACGIPVVATRVGGIADALGSGGGRVVSPRDPDAIALETVDLVTNRRARHALGTLARHAVADRMSLEHCVDAHVTALDRALLRRSHPGASGRTSRRHAR